MRTLRLAAVILLGAILLAVTNPTQAEFHEYLKTEAVRQVQGAGQPDSLYTIVNTVFALANTEYSRQTAQRQDYVVFSLYKVNLEGKEATYAGALKRFVRVR